MKRVKARTRAPRHKRPMNAIEKERSEKELQKLLNKKSYKDTDQSSPNSHT